MKWWEEYPRLVWFLFWLEGVALGIPIGYIVGRLAG